MKKLLMSMGLALCANVMWAQKHQINLSGNAYVTKDHDGAAILKDGLGEWQSSKSVISTYVYLHQPAEFTLSLQAKGRSDISVKIGNQKRYADIHSLTYDEAKVGKFKVDKPGYMRIDIQGISKESEDFGSIKSITLDGVEGELSYVRDFSDYWGRRGPSTHMGYALPEGKDIEWFYNELTVPKKGETMHSYYMAAGFGEGYFGIQYNSDTERRVLFSVWSPFDTQDPKLIPEDEQIKMLKRGKDVHIGEFGNEGSGGQSYLKYNWKAGKTYKFAMQVRPDGKGNTIYTAYFYATDDKEWRLIASFLRPKTDTWYKRPHSFLENFSPNQGYLAREVNFSNQWACTKEGKWIRLDNAKFTYDATAGAGVRKDYQGGVRSNGDFYLKMGGFFDENTKLNTQYQSKDKGKKPNLKGIEKL